MKKVLILAYDFPPYNSIGGQRPYSWYKYFKEYGLYPVVVTRQWDENIENAIDYIKPSKNRNIEIEETEYGTIIRAPFHPNLRDKIIIKFGLNKYSAFRRILTLFYQLVEFIFPFFDNKRTIHSAAINYLKNNKIDCIIATGEPFILFKYANKLSNKYKIPWIADYRDGWSQNYNRSKFEQVFYYYFEKKLICSALLITTVSKEFCNQINFLFPDKDCEIIMNGYFPEQFEDVQYAKNECFTIAFSGTLYSYQPIEMFASALKNVLTISNNIMVRLLFLGIEFQPSQLERIKSIFKFCAENLETTPRLPHKIAIDKLQKCDLLLLPASAQYPQTYAKVFDYLKIRKPIMLFESDNGSLEQIISETQSGVICNTQKDIEDSLLKLYNEWNISQTAIGYSSNIETYSRKEQTKKLCELINHSI